MRKCVCVEYVCGCASIAAASVSILVFVLDFF